MKKIFTILCIAMSWTTYGQIQQDINKTSGTVSNAINDIDSIRFNSVTGVMEVVLNSGNVDSHTISDIDSVTFGPTAPPTSVTATAAPNPVCEDSSLTLTGGATNATSWSWTGPNGFASNLQSPTITNITPADAGVYTLIASNTFGPAVAVSTVSVTINTVPTAVINSAGSNISSTEFDANWTAASGATNYYIDVADDAGFNNLIVSNQSVGNVLTYNVNGLICETDYYYRIRAENNCGTSTNSDALMVTTGVCLNCGSSFTDTRDNESYGTVQIGNQCWMSENLNYTPSVGSSWCYDDVSSVCVTYGRLYDWNTASNSTSGSTNPSGVQGVCPSGWHLPSDDEWKELEMELGMTQVEADGIGFRGTDQGEQLKTSYWGGTNSSGFTALPGGYRSVSGAYIVMGSLGRWWTATESGSKAWMRTLELSADDVVRGNTFGKGYGFSVRCVMD